MMSIASPAPGTPYVKTRMETGNRFDSRPTEKSKLRLTVQEVGQNFVGEWMSGRKDRTPDDPLPEQETGAAFDLWLKRGLHQLFDDVANEPLPEELLKLIEADRDGKS